MVGLDNQHQEAFVHTPVRVVVDLKRTRLTLVLKASQEETSLASAPAPQTTVAQMVNIKSRRCFDVMAAVHSISVVAPVGHPPVADVHLVGGTLTTKSKTAEDSEMSGEVTHRPTAVVSQHGGHVRWPPEWFSSRS